MTKKYDAKITISRNSDNMINIRLKDNSGIEFFDGEMTSL